MISGYMGTFCFNLTRINLNVNKAVMNAYINKILVSYHTKTAVDRKILALEIKEIAEDSFF